MTKRPLWRRILRVAKWTLGTLLVLVVLLVAFLHTSWGKSFVRGRIEARLNGLVNGEVTLGSLDYGFLFSSVELGDLEIKDASGRPAIRVGKLAADLDRGSILDGKPLIEDLTIDGLAVAIVRNADGTTNLTGLFKPSDRKPLEQIRVAKLSIAGGATLTRPDGSVIAISDLLVTGDVDARPASKTLDVALAHLEAKVTVREKQIAVAIDGVKLGRRPEAIDVTTGAITAGALAIESLVAHVGLADGKPAGQQKLVLGKTRVNSKQLALLLGRDVLVDDVALELTVTGPMDRLVVHGDVKTRETTLALDGTADASTLARPSYQLALVGKGKSSDVVKREGKLPVEGSIRIDVTGSGIKKEELDAVLAIAVGKTTVGAYELESLTAKAVAKQGAYKLERLDAAGLGFEVEANGSLAADKELVAKVRVHGSPEKAIGMLTAAGVAIPKRVPALKTLDVTVDAAGKLDGTVAVDVAPTTIAIAGGRVGLRGHAELVNRKLASVDAKVQLSGIDIGSAARLAGRPPPKVQGSVDGTIDITKVGDDRSADYNLAIALRDPAVRVVASGHASASGATANAKVLRTSDRAVLATIDARLPLDQQGFQPRGSWKVSADVAKRSLDEVQALLPSLREKKLPANAAVAVHVELAGSPAAPTGTIVVAASQEARTLNLEARISSSAKGLAIATTGTIADQPHGTLATISGGVTTGSPFKGKKLDVAALRAAAQLGVTIDIKDRELASLADLRAKLADLGGTLDGTIAVRGALAKPELDANLRWHGYKTADGGTGETTIKATGSPSLITATISHTGKLTIVADIDRSTPDRIGVHAKVRAAETPLLPLIPATFGEKLAAHQAGMVRSDLEGTFTLVRGDAGLALAEGRVTGSLDITGAAITIPNSNGRRWHDLNLAIAGEPQGVRIKSISMRETDISSKQRRLDVTGFLTLENMKAKQLTLTLAANDWLVFGTPLLGANDAPRAAADFDIGVAVDLASPTIGVDATIRSLAFRAPDRLERGHQPEFASVSGDIIYVDGNTVIGQLPVTPIVAAAPPKERRPIDIRVHIPKAIRLEQAPFDVMATGELTVAVRTEGVTTRGELKMHTGVLSLFGYAHPLVEGSLTFNEQHPKGYLSLTFERDLPDVALRQLARPGGATMTFTGAPTKPKPTIGGDVNAALFELMAMYQAGRPLYVTRPDMPASNTVQVPRGDQLFVLTFMAQNLPHLLFLDRVAAWADPYEQPGAYGQIRNVEAESYSAHRRVRAVVRPPVPGRSQAELQWDRVFVNSDRAAFGAGLRAGDRVGGGLGLFLEWSSKD